jgi:uncharacterized protein
MDEEQLDEILTTTRRIAVIGMREEGAAGRIPLYLMDAAFEIVPVNPNFDEVFGLPTVDSLDELEEAVDMVQLFRRSEDVPMHVDEILRARPRYVWMQSGIRNDQAAKTLTEAGITVVQDRCLMTDHRRRSATA